MEELGFLPRIGLGYYLPSLRKKDIDLFLRMRVVIGWYERSESFFTGHEIGDIAAAFYSEKAKPCETYHELHRNVTEKVSALIHDEGRKKVARGLEIETFFKSTYSCKETSAKRGGSND